MLFNINKILDKLKNVVAKNETAQPKATGK